MSENIITENKVKNKGGKGRNNKKRNKEFYANQFKKGVVSNPNGRPKGRKDFRNMFFDAVQKLAQKEKVSPEDYHLSIIETGIKLSKSGNFNFYKDTIDRVHGSVVNKNINETNIIIDENKKKNIDDILDEI